MDAKDDGKSQNKERKHSLSVGAVIFVFANTGGDPGEYEEQRRLHGLPQPHCSPIFPFMSNRPMWSLPGIARDKKTSCFFNESVR